MNQADFIMAIRGFTKMLDPEVQTDALLISYLRLGEERISDDLRCADMIQIDTAILQTNRVKLPADYREMDFIRNLDSGFPIRYKTRDEFYTEGQPSGYFTTSGLFLMVGGAFSVGAPLNVEMHYFGDVPPLNDVETWLSKRYPRVLIDATMAVASMGMVEDDRALTWETDAAARIKAMNDMYTMSKAKGSKLNRKAKGFG